MPKDQILINLRSLFTAQKCKKLNKNVSNKLVEKNDEKSLKKTKNDPPPPGSPPHTHTPGVPWGNCQGRGFPAFRRGVKFTSKSKWTPNRTESKSNRIESNRIESNRIESKSNRIESNQIESNRKAPLTRRQVGGFVLKTWNGVI